MNRVQATGQILNVYQTGDRPVLLLCSDGNSYIAKYKQPGGGAYKLVNELIGSSFASLWGIHTPAYSFIVNDPIIWDGLGISHDPNAPLLGSRKMERVFDVHEINSHQVKASNETLGQILKIALFDLWLANDDRTCNNYNLLYDLDQHNVVSIDYAGIFNSGILNQAIYQLNYIDSILNSSLFVNLKNTSLQTQVDNLRRLFLMYASRCYKSVKGILEIVPGEWNVDITVVERKLGEIFEKSWLDETWENFVCLTNY